MEPLIVEPREVKLSTRTEISVRRLIPHAKLRRVGAWVFLDHFGPTPQVDGMRVQRHPHTGLQTVTWLFDGLVEHCDSIGSRQQIRPGQLNIMTAGRGIAHSELSLSGAGTQLHATQLWLALPAEHARTAPAFQHVADSVKIRFDATVFDLFIGEFAGLKSQATTYSPVVGAQLRVAGRSYLPLRADWQYALLTVAGTATITLSGESAPTELPANQLAYLGESHRGIWLDVPEGQTATMLLIGGEPFAEEIIMWWNFIARSPEELAEMRERWNLEGETQDQGLARTSYPLFDDGLGGWIPAPDLPNVTLRPRGL